MKFKRKPLSKMSSRGKLRKEIGKLHLEILRKQRGDICEICRLPGNVGRFHILPVGRYPKLEFHDGNVLLTHWLHCCQAHYLWHHAGPADHKNLRTLNRIRELRGANWEEELRAIDLTMPRHDGLFLLALRETMKKELNRA